MKNHKSFFSPFIISFNIYLIKTINNLFIQFINTFEFFVLIIGSKINMAATRRSKSILHNHLSTRKINTSFYVQKYYSTNLWCTDCNDSMILDDRGKVLPCKK